MIFGGCTLQKSEKRENLEVGEGIKGIGKKDV